MAAPHDSDSLLFPAPSSSIEGDYLRYLAQRVPKDIGHQLDHDSQPELSLSKSVSLADLTRPLSAGAFPSGNNWEMAWILGHTITSYTEPFDAETVRPHPYGVIYAISLYLHCFVQGKGPGHSGYISALARLVDLSWGMDLETRLQVSRFLGSLITTMRAREYTDNAVLDEPGPLSSAMIALSLIIASVACDLGLETGKMVKNEGTSSAWAEVEAYGAGSTFWGIGVLKRYISEMYGATGKVRQVADGFVRFVDESNPAAIGIASRMTSVFDTAVEACLTLPTKAEQIECLQGVFEAFKDTCDTKKITQLLQELQVRKEE